MKKYLLVGLCLLGSGVGQANQLSINWGTTFGPHCEYLIAKGGSYDTPIIYPDISSSRKGFIVEQDSFLKLAEKWKPTKTFVGPGNFRCYRSPPEFGGRLYVLILKTGAHVSVPLDWQIEETEEEASSLFAQAVRRRMPIEERRPCPYCGE